VILPLSIRDPVKTIGSTGMQQIVITLSETETTVSRIIFMVKRTVFLSVQSFW